MIKLNLSTITCIVIAISLSYRTVYANDDQFVNQYLTPPYNEIIFGKKLDNEFDEHLPKISASVLVAFFNDCDAKVLHKFSTSIISKAVEQPEININVLRDIDKVSVTSKVADNQLTKYANKVAVGIANENKRIASVKAINSVSLMAASKKMETSQERKRVSTEYMETKTSVAGSFSDVKANVTNSITSTEKYTSEQRTTIAIAKLNPSAKDLVGEKTESGIYKMSRNKMDSIGQSSVSSDFNMSKAIDVSKSKGLNDSDILNANKDTDVFDGIYDKDNMLMNLDADEIVSLNEIENYKSFLCSEPALKDVFKDNTRTVAKQVCSSTSVDLDVEILPSKLYHGQMAEIIIQTKNTGNAPIYNIFIIGGVPPKTTFIGFKNARKEYRGYAEFYAKTCNTFGIKLTRPLFPGEKMITTIFAKLDRWLVK